MRPSRSLIVAIALAVGSLGLYRWVRPPAADPRDPAAATTSTTADPASVLGRSLAVSAHAAAKRVPVQALAPGRRPAPQDPEFPWRARNTDKTVDQLRSDPRALVLRNALIDTRTGEPLPLPESLVAGPEPGFHIVQFTHEPDAESRRRLEEQRLQVVSYLPVNAFLVKGSDESVERLALDADIASVSPWHPAFKLEPELLTRAIDGRPLEAGDRLMLSLSDPDALPRLEALGVREVVRQRSPFGTLVTVDVPPDALVALARSPEVHLIEKAHRRELLNDRSAFLLGSATDVTNTASYRGLTGSNVVVNVNDSGIDWTHPDLTTNRVFTVGSQTNLLTDRDGHGTHVAGTIAGSGVRSLEIQGPAQGSVTNAQFRGHAPNAKLFVLPIDLQTGPTISDAFLQEQAAMTNALISNNSWGYTGAYEYNSISASYDAASRDALPETTGEQPVLFVFAAGNSGQGGNNGVGGLRGSVTVPGNAKNVITVGALESRRNLTNAVVTDDEGHVIWAGGKQFREPATNAELTTNLVLRVSTDTDTEVANFSSRGNVGIGIEGSYGRFKPDVVAPGSQILSARSSQWRLEDEYDTNSVQYAVFDDLNRPVAPWYRFLSGTSLAAPAVSGMLAQIQEFWHRPGITLPRFIEAAAYKALVINSARPSADLYAPNFRSVMNYAGWGRPSLPRALDSGVRLTRADGAIVELAGFAGELTTGASQSLRLRLTTNEIAATGAFHFTLVWTDPPGNPAAGIKLVNDLDLVVSNTVTGEVFVGNDLGRGGYTVGRPGTNAFETVEAGVTNSIFDSVNNVERVVLEPPLASEYIIQVVARRVNVNALASREVQNLQNRLGIVQDFVVALSSEAATNDTIVATAEYVTGSGGAFGAIQPPAVSVVATNGIPVAASRVGAQSPLLGGSAGQAAQWHFFVFTNLFNPEAAAATGLTNGQYVEFVIASAANLARPRGPGGTGTRLRERVLGPDLDLYMSTDPGLTNLQASALASAYRSTLQGSDERIEITNAPANGEVYYIGVKAEDQQAGEFELVVRSSDKPFHILGSNGYSLLMTPVGGGRAIPDGSPDAPGVVRYFGTGPAGITRNVTFTQSLIHDNFFDLDRGDGSGHVGENDRATLDGAGELRGEVALAVDGGIEAQLHTGRVVEKHEIGAGLEGRDITHGDADHARPQQGGHPIIGIGVVGVGKCLSTDV
ncbi:MAG: S8 family serine peptidase, partial [Verrucomicrobiota bacterium]